MYRIFSAWRRWQACKMAAQVMTMCGDDEGICPRVWSLAVFFETYMAEGADGTVADFGPKEPVEIKAIERTS
jgi:hypothetical protein